jgi:TolA-binding protein
MNSNSKKLLEDYKNESLDDKTTEGVEQSIVREATRIADREKWRAMLAEEGNQRTETPLSVVKKPSGTIRRLMPYAVGLAAAIAFLVMFVLRTENFDDMIAGSPYPVAEVRMGQNDDEESWKKAMDAYKNKRYSEAARNITAITTPTNEQRFYLALSYIYQESPDFTKATPIFRDFVDRKDAVYDEEARWFLAYSLFKSGQKEEAKGVLTDIVNRKGYNHEKAKSILKHEFD